MTRLALFAFLALSPLAVGAEPTEAERASEALTPLTEAQIARLQAECPLMTTTPSEFTRIDGEVAVLAELPALVLARLIAFDPAFQPGGTGEGVTVWPPLPHGGVGPRDICEPFVRLPVARADSAAPNEVGLRFRPGVDIAGDYPLTAAQLDANDQLLLPAAATWALVMMPAENQIAAMQAAADWLARHGQDPALDPSGHVLWLNGMLFLPLAPTGPVR